MKIWISTDGARLFIKVAPFIGKALKALLMLLV